MRSAFVQFLAALVVATTLSLAAPAADTPRQIGAQTQPADKAPELRFDPARDFTVWQTALRSRLVKLLALPSGPRQALRSSITPEPPTDLYAVERIEFD